MVWRVARGAASRHCCSIFFPAAYTVALQRFSTDVDTLADIVRLDKGVPQEEGLGAEEASTEVTRELWSMLYADDGSSVFRSGSGSTKMMMVTSGVCAAFGLTVRMPEPVRTL